MGNTLWNKLNNRNKNRKSNYEISKKTNIPEEKVEEIMNGERQVPSDRVDSFVSAIQENNNLERSINSATAKKWIEETDLKALRREFNYQSQVELAKELNIDTSVICRLENKKIDHVSDNFLIKFYDFYHDELNKKVKRKTKKKNNQIKIREKDLDLKGISFEDAIKWYKDFDLKGYLNEKGYSYKDFALRLGYSPSSTSMVSNLVNHTVDITTTGRFIVVKAYAFVNGLLKPKSGTVIVHKKDPNLESGYVMSVEAQNIAVEPQKEENDITVEETTNEAPEVKETPNLEDVEDYFLQVGNIPRQTYPYTISTATLDNGHLDISHRVVDEEKITIYKHVWDDTQKELEEKNKKIEELKLQVSRYEKLIDMIK